MMKNKVLLLVSVILFCMAACISAEEPKKKGGITMDGIMSVDEFKKQLNNPEFLERVSFFVAYDKEKAEPILVSSSDTKEPKTLGTAMKKEALEKILKENVEMTSTAILRTYGSPGCQIMTAFGEYIVTCW